MTEEQIKQYCQDHGLTFSPWEIPPWEADVQECPYPEHTAGAYSWDKARKLRAQIIEELNG